mgnify:FL=1
MNDQNREKLNFIRKSFIKFLQDNKRTDSLIFEEYSNLELDELIDVMRDKLYYYKTYKSLYMAKLIEEFQLEQDNLDVIKKLESYFDLFDKVVYILN